MAQQQSPSNKVQRWALFTKQNPWTVDILELISFLEFYCYFQQHIDLNKGGRLNVVRININISKLAVRLQDEQSF